MFHHWSWYRHGLPGPVHLKYHKTIRLDEIRSFKTIDKSSTIKSICTGECHQENFRSYKAVEKMFCDDMLMNVTL